MPAQGTVAYNSSLGGSSPISTQTATISNALSSGSSALNPRDAPGYVPGTLPGDNPSGGKAVATTPLMGETGTNLAQATQATGTANQYQVQQGDTLSGIAKAQGVNVGDISGYKSGNPNLIYPGETLSIGQQYKNAANLAKQSGINSPSGQGAGQAGVGQFMATQASAPEAPSLLGGIQEVDSNFDSLFQNYDKYFEPLNQKTSLLDEYRAFSKELGIGKLDEEILNAKLLLEGTEDTIRDSITASGGTASDMHIRLLANAANKQNLKNYNTLLDTRNAAMTQLGTFMELTTQDRKAAESEFDRKMDFANQIMTYKDRFTDNARAGYNSIVSNVGYDGLYTSVQSSPYETSLVEKSLGLAPGGLSKLAQQATLKQQSETRLSEREARLSGGSTGSGGITVTDGNIEDQIANLKLSTAQKSDLVDIQTLNEQINSIQSLAADGVLEGIGSLGLGTGKELAFKIFGSGSEEGARVRTTIGNIKGQIAKLRGGTSFTTNEEKLLNSYVPGINESTPSVLAKLNGLKSFLASKQNAIIQVGGGSVQGSANDPLKIR